MLTRRHIRTKVMQCIYVTKHSNGDSLKKEITFLNKSMQDMYELFVLNINLLKHVHQRAEIYFEQNKKKYFASEEDKSPNIKFLNNRILVKIKNSKLLDKINHQKKIDTWSYDDEYPALLWNALLTSDLYKRYLDQKEDSFAIDKKFILMMYKEIIAPNEKLYAYFEDHKLTWIDDLPIVNTSIAKFLKHLPDNSEDLRFPDLFKNEEDKDFAIELLKKTLLNESEYSNDIVKNTKNWDKDRITDVDYILLIMACTELVHFSSIPVKVTINEYLEIAKDYSTPKSSYFVNGILDKIVSQYKSDNKLNKTGRGLI